MVYPHFLGDVMVTGRDMLRVDGVPPETKKQLQEAARQLYGKPNASLLVRSLIAGHLSKSGATVQPLTAADAADFSFSVRRMAYLFMASVCPRRPHFGKCGLTTHC